ncbi:MAG: glycosyltransferase [Ktedonobacterales bacterium]|nr:glycosyltransferase [Ktedonobacterales bacterium]
MIFLLTMPLVLVPLVRALALLLALTLAVPLAYLALLSGAALLAAHGPTRWLSGRGGARARAAIPLHALPTFALLVPAHDEEAVLGRLLASLQALDYPIARREVFVVADNCADATAAVARAAGANVYERSDAQRRSKGHALAWLLGKLEAEGRYFEAYVVVDADSALSPDFLMRMAEALAAGAMAAQAQYRVLNADQGGAAGLRALAFALFNHVRPLGRSSLGWSAGLKGNGMCFRRETLTRAGWNAYALAEDVEYHATLLLAGFRVAYVPGAIVASEMPTSLRQARSQQARWERGRLELARRHVPSLLRRFARTGDIALLDAAMEIVLPPLALVVCGVALSAAAALVTRWPPVIWLAIGLCVALALYLGAGALLARLPPRAWLSLAGAPAYVLWKSGVYVSALATRGASRWVRTERATPPPAERAAPSPPFR